MRVGVLGGGLQGCCIALALADKGATVTLIDRNEVLISRAGVANEGKIHLGYMYANDLTLNTAKTMIRGALDFAPFFSRHLGIAINVMTTSEPAHYLVHRDSHRDLDLVEGYLHRVHDILEEAAHGRGKSYFGIDLSEGLRRWTAAESEAVFDPKAVRAAFATPEVAINPVALADRVRAAIGASPRIEVRCSETVVATREVAGGVEVRSEAATGPVRETFDHVVNALWDGRLAVDQSFGLSPPRPWLHRLKYGVSLRITSAQRPPSVTIVSGPFGEVVSYGEGLTYLTWYPECLKDITSALQPPDWPTYPVEPLRSCIIERTFEALAGIVKPLQDVGQDELAEVHVKGGAILAWGETDIYDPDSELHERYRVGVTSHGRFHSVDPGKLTMAPYFAQLCADRIMLARASGC